MAAGGEDVPGFLLMCGFFFYSAWFFKSWLQWHGRGDSDVLTGLYFRVHNVQNAEIRLTLYLNTRPVILLGFCQLFCTSKTIKKYNKKIWEPWLVYLSGLSMSLQTKGSLVQFPVRAHAWVVGQVPSWGRMRGNHTLMFLSLSLPFPFSKIKGMKSEKKKEGSKPVTAQNI